MPMKSYKFLLIVGDGMGDRPIPELNFKTPLEYAVTPNLDSLAKRGITGIMDVIKPGIPPGSAPAHLALLSYDPYASYTGRGAFEALGLNIKLERGDVAFRCNFATVDEELKIVDRRAGRSIPEADILASSLNKISIDVDPPVKIIFKHSVEHRGVLILRGSNLSSKVSDIDPGREGEKILWAKPLIDDYSAYRTAKILNEFVRRAHEILEDHPANKARSNKGLPPANFILCRGAGTLPQLKSFTEKFGLKGICIAGITLIKGVARTIGFDAPLIEGATGGLDTDVYAKAKAALKYMESYDFIFIHVKGTDTASHDGLIESKVKMIEKIDGMVGRILDFKNVSNLCIAVTADHATPISIRDHTGDPVPLLIHAPGILSDDVCMFSEKACMKGGLGRIRGLNLIPILLNYAGVMHKFGE